MFSSQHSKGIAYELKRQCLIEQSTPEQNLPASGHSPGCQMVNLDCNEGFLLA